MKKGRFVVVSGPSGVGKGTICNKLIDELGAEYSVSYTTRSPREGEVDGVNYNFISRADFERKIREGDFIEYNLYNGNYYGTSRDFVIDKLNKGIDVFTEIDVNGAKNIKRMFSDALLIYIAPPSMEELKKRLIGRGTEDKDIIEERLKIAEEELKYKDMYDYGVINDDIEKATRMVKDIIEGNLCDG